MKQMTYAEVFERKELLASLKITLSSKVFAKTVLLNLKYNKIVRDFYDSVRDNVLKKMPGFVDRADEVNKMLEIENRVKECKEWREGDSEFPPAMPSDEQIQRAKEIRETVYEQHVAEEKEYTKMFNEGIKNDLIKTIGVENGLFTKEEYATICMDLPAQGSTVTVNSLWHGEERTVPVADFLVFLAAALVDYE